MPTAPKTSNFDKREPIKPGTYPARCYSVVIEGTFDEEFKGEHHDLQKVRITWELPTVLITYKKKKEDGTEEEVTAPSVIGQEYTFSMGKKANLRKMIESMTTPLSDEEAFAFDIFDLVGLTCMMAVANKQRKDGQGSYAVIQSIMPLMREISIPTQINPSVRFDFNNWDQGVFESLPKFVRERIDESLERKRKIEKEMDLDVEEETEIPF